MKENRGITLIALIITVVVLLILAVVTISAVNDGGIFEYANNAATKYNSASIKENDLLIDYLSEMAKHDGEGSLTSPISGKYYFLQDRDSEEKEYAAITINGTTVTGGFYNSEDISNMQTTLNGNILTITYTLYEKNEYVQSEDVYYINEDGLMFNYSDGNLDRLDYVKSDATNVNYSLLNGMKFKEDGGTNTIEFLNDGTINFHNGHDIGAYYACYKNTDLYLFSYHYKINYQGGEISSITLQNTGNAGITYSLFTE